MNNKEQYDYDKHDIEPDLIEKIEELDSSGKHEEMYNLIKPLADKGVAYAQARLGDLYRCGAWVKQDYKEAIRYYKLSAEQGDTDGLFSLGISYRDGEGVEKNYNEAFKYLKLAADKGDMDSQAEIGQMYLNKDYGAQDYNEAFKYLKLAADQGDEDSIIDVGEMYYKGLGISQNYNEALKYFKLAADKDFNKGLYYIGNMYENGYGVPQNLSEAVKYYELASEKGSILANEALNRINKKSKDTSKDDSDFKAEIYYKLGKQYENGDRLPKDLNAAIFSYKKAADKGHSDARLALERLEKKKGFCFITTAVCQCFNKPDDCYELTRFRQFRDNWLINEIDGEEIIKEYYTNAPKIVSAINARSNKEEIYLNIWNTYLKLCLNYIENKKYSECKALYIKMVRDLEKIYGNIN